MSNRMENGSEAGFHRGSPGFSKIITNTILMSASGTLYTINRQGTSNHDTGSYRKCLPSISCSSFSHN